MKKQIPYLIMLLPPLFWAGNFIVGKAVSSQHIPIGLSFWRWFLATLIFTPFVIKAIIKEKDIILKHLPKIIILSLLSISAFNSLAYISLQYTSAINATILNSFIPIFILIIVSLFFKEKISKYQVVGIFISLLGVFIILSRLDINIIKNITFNKGDLWMLVAALDWAMYSILLKYLRPTELKPMTFLGIMMIIGTIFLIPLYLANPFNESMITLNKNVIYALLYIAIFPSIISYLAWNYGLQKIGAALGGQYIHLMPIFGALMAVLFLGERIELYHILGGISIGLGLWLSMQKHKEAI